MIKMYSIVIKLYYIKIINFAMFVNKYIIYIYIYCNIFCITKLQ